MHGSSTAITLTDQILDAAERLALSADADARAMAVACMFDWTACAIAGASEPLVDKLVADAIEFGRPGDFPILGRSETVGLREAVLINGAASHALDYDDTLRAMIGHPSVPIMPALVGLAAYLGTSGADLITAYIFAVEVGSRVTMAIAPDHYLRGYHNTSTSGAIGAAAGCAWLLGLDRAQRASAIGLAATRAAGLKASFGTEAKPLNPGWAALVGLTAAQWAARGYEGPSDALGHQTGIRAWSQDFNPAAALADGPPKVLGIRFKRYAACGGIHPTIEAALQLRRDYRLAPEDIARATVFADSDMDGTCNKQQVATGLEAKFSLRMVTAMVLADLDTSLPENFSDSVIARPLLRDLFDRTTVDLIQGRDSMIGDVVVETSDGRRLQSTFDFGKVDPVAEMQSVRPKFVALTAPKLGEQRASRLAAIIEGLESRPSVTAMLAAGSAGALNTPIS